jgi:prepilin-type N-terminal cleavage/methylation domain-containing protein
MTPRGTTLVELLVALALGSLVVAMCATALVGQRRAERRVAESTRPGSAADEAVRVVAAALARVAASDTLVARGDTALEWRATLGGAVACAGGGDSLVVPVRVLRLRDSITTSGAVLVRVTRRVRFMLYRGGDARWWLGQRTCSASAPVSCGAAQPVAGPLSPSPMGLRVAIDSSGSIRVVTVQARAQRAVREAVVSIRP